MTNWKQVAIKYPEFVQWIAQRDGGLPEGEVTREDWDRYSLEYQAARGA